MAYTVTKVQNTVFGNMRTLLLDVTADAATQNVVTGLQHIYGFSVGPQSLSTGAPHIYANSAVSGTAIAGTLGCSGFVSGDEFFVTVYGR